jgi:hypothetical protein
MAKTEIYYIEFSDEESRRIRDIPYNRSIVASSRNEAKRKLLRELNKKFPKNKIKIEAVFSPK